MHTVRRYLAAFGPASIEDISSWTSIRTPPIRQALEALGAAVRPFRGESGVTLYDLASAPRPPADTAAPVRFLPKWDSTLLAYAPADRVRILPERYRRSVIIKNGDVAQIVLLDGFVAGAWEVERSGRTARLVVHPFGRLGRAERAALTEEGQGLLRSMPSNASSYEVRIG